MNETTIKMAQIFKNKTKYLRRLSLNQRKIECFIIYCFGALAALVIWCFNVISALCSKQMPSRVADDCGSMKLQVLLNRFLYF